MKKIFLTLSALLLALVSYAADKVTLTVQNALSTERAFEVVEVDAQLVKQKLGTEQFIITDADGKRVRMDEEEEAEIEAGDIIP